MKTNEPSGLSPLEESIEHWRRLATGNRLPQESHFGDNCALCTEFYDLGGDDEDTCIGCPIREKTGMGHCSGSPWEAADLASDKGYDSNEFKSSAQVMLDFLISLRPEVK